MAAARDSRQYFTTKLTQRKYFEGYREVPGTRRNTIPWIVKKELGNEVSYVFDWETESFTYKSRYESVCKALGYGDEFLEKTRHLHSSSSSSPKSNNVDDWDGLGSTSRSRSFRTARQSTDSCSDLQQARKADDTSSRPSNSISDTSETSRLRRQLLEEDGSDDTNSRGSPTRQSVAPQRTKRMMADPSAQLLGDTDSMRRRKPPYEISSSGELLVSTSLGESAPGTQSTKRRIPDSPTSQLQPSNAERRRPRTRATSNREESDPPSYSGTTD